MPGASKGRKGPEGAVFESCWFSCFWMVSRQVYTVMVIIAFVFYLHYSVVFAGIATNRSLKSFFLRR